MLDLVSRTPLEVPKGHVKVQLFGGKLGDKLQHEQEVDNFVSPRFLRALSKLYSSSFFTPDTVQSGTGGPTNVGMAGYGSRLFGGQVSPFTGLALTDFAGATSPEGERTVQGIIKGVASFKSATNGAYRGSYNDVESVNQFGYHKFVYDFSSAQALGTFQSIYTGPWVANSTSAPEINHNVMSLLGNPTKFVAGNDGVFIRDHATGDLYRLVDSTHIQKVASLEELLNVMFYGASWSNATLTLPAPGMNNFGYKPAIKDGYLYWITDQTTPTFVKAPLSNLSSVTTIQTMNSTWWTANGLPGSMSKSYFGGLEYFPADDQFLFQWHDSYGATTFQNHRFCIMNPANFNIVDRYVSNRTNGGVGSFPGVTSWKKMTMFGSGATTANISYTQSGDTFILNNSDGSVINRGTVMMAYTWGMPVLLPGGDLMITPAAKGSTYQGSIFNVMPAQEFFSRALLADPVTKLSTQSMKITYEFTMPSLV